MIQSEKKWHTCSGCGKNLSSYRSLWRYKKNCGSRPSYNVPAVPAIRDRAPLMLRSHDISTIIAGVEKKLAQPIQR